MDIIAQLTACVSSSTFAPCRAPAAIRSSTARPFPPSLAEAGIAYRYEPRLGGLRRPRRDSPNRGWRNDSFRGIADYMLTREFESGLRDLVAEAGRTPLAIMCAEAVPWRCHRSLIADALLARGQEVLHLSATGATKKHRQTPFARLEGSIVTYPAEEETARRSASFSSDPIEETIEIVTY